jgi:hypothetical protein
MKNPKLLINIWLLWFIVLLYSFISLVVFTFASDGWISMIYFVCFGSIVFVGFSAIVLLISIYCSIKHTMKVEVSFNSLILVLMAQIVAVFNVVGDCGDSGVAFTFINRIDAWLTGADVCRINYHISPMSMNLFYVSILLYMASLVYFIFSINASTGHDQG